MGSDGGWAPVESKKAPATSEAPAAPAAPATPEAPAAPDDSKSTDGKTTYDPAYGPSRSSALLSVRVPEEAKVFVNQVATRSRGRQRHYVSRNLKPGRAYTFSVRAELQRNGKRISQTKVVKLSAGGSANLAFDLSQAAEEEKVAEKPAETKLTVHVPADARVFLAGRLTEMTGAVREYRTTKLSPGESWSDYTIRVAVERDGQTRTREKTITFVAGQDYDLTFDFDTPRIADHLAAATK